MRESSVDRIRHTPPHTTKLVKRDSSRTGTILAASAAALYNMYRARKVAATRIAISWPRSASKSDRAVAIPAATDPTSSCVAELGRLAAVRARAAVGLLSVKGLRGCRRRRACHNTRSPTRPYRRGEKPTARRPSRGSRQRNSERRAWLQFGDLERVFQKEPRCAPADP